jgi:hypothetical protein
MGKETCPSCGEEIFNENGLFHRQNKVMSCYICQKSGCESCFFSHRSGVMRILVDNRTVVTCSRECAGIASERARVLTKNPKQAKRRYLKEITIPDERKWKIVKELAKAYFSLDNVKRRTLRKFGNMNIGRVETWEIPDPDYHRDAPLLMFHEEINDLLHEWGKRSLDREEMIILLSFDIYDKLVYSLSSELNINEYSSLEASMDSIVVSLLKENVDMYGRDREYTGDIFSSLWIFQKVFTLWVFIYTRFGMDLDPKKLLKYFDYHYYQMTDTTTVIGSKRNRSNGAVYQFRT